MMGKIIGSKRTPRNSDLDQFSSKSNRPRIKTTEERSPTQTKTLKPNRFGLRRKTKTHNRKTK
jgi:hypothetical protein